jgi:hypothetical protein
VLHNVVRRIDVRARFHVVGGEACLVREIRVQRHVAPEIHHVNQKLLPRSLRKRSKSLNSKNRTEEEVDIAYAINKCTQP